MNTSDIKNEVYKQALKVFDPPLTKSDIAFLVDATLDTLASGLVTGGFKHRKGEEGKVLIRGFGTFRRTIRKGRDYKVHDRVHTVPDRVTVTFKPGAQLARSLKK